MFLIKRLTSPRIVQNIDFLKFKIWTSRNLKYKLQEVKKVFYKMLKSPQRAARIEIVSGTHLPVLPTLEYGLKRAALSYAGA